MRTNPHIKEIIMLKKTAITLATVVGVGALARLIVARIKG